MLYNFLTENREEILAMTEKKTVELAGSGPSSDQLRLGLPIFFEQLMKVLIRVPDSDSSVDKVARSKGARESDEEAIAQAGHRPDEAEVAKSAGLHGVELLRLGYTLSHVVHAYGAMCQSVTELATKKKTQITTTEFHDMNRILDIGIAGAVTSFDLQKSLQETSREVQHLGFLAHELRNALTAVNLSFQMIKKGSVGLGGNTGKVMEKGLQRIGELIDRSLTEVRLRVDPKVHVEAGNLLQLIDQLLISARVEAQTRNQSFVIHVDPTLIIEADLQLFYSALSNLIQNALKYTRTGGKIQVRANLEEENIVIEIEDECGGRLPESTPHKLFKPFEQQHENRTGLGLGLTIAQRAMELNNGFILARNLPGKGCIFKMSLPRKAYHQSQQNSL